MLLCFWDWEEMDVMLKRKDPILFKIGSHLTHEEISMSKGMIIELRDVFAWLYVALKRFSVYFVLSHILLLLGTISITQKNEEYLQSCLL